MRFNAFLGCALMAASVEAFYISGVMHASHEKGKAIGIKVNSLTSIQNIMPYEWYSLPFCSPGDEDKMLFATKSQNLGEVLFGDKIEISLYSVKMREDMTCVAMCERTYDESKMRQFRNRIEQKYRGNMILDGLPVAEEPTTDRQVTQAAVQIGFPLGVPRAVTQKGQTLLNNHLAFTVYYNKHETQDVMAAQAEAAEERYRIVGFQVSPYSVDHEEAPCTEKFTPEGAKQLSANDGKPSTKVTWSYSVKWVEDPKVTWSTRWDVYLRSSPIESRIHWFAIINSLLVVILLSVIVAIILLRALHKDFNRYNDYENEEEQQEETGWKLVHTEVFRKPPHALWLCVYVGTGAQLLGMSVVTLVFALLGFLSPANRGALMSALIFLFVLLGSHAGYTSARMLKMFDMREWRHIFVVGLFFPGQMVFIWFCLNLVLWSQNSASAVPFKTVLTIMALWLGVSLVLVLLGAVVGFKASKIEPICKVNKVPRTLPPQPWYLRAPQCMLLPGVLPFGAAFIESVFILSSVWQGRVYYVFGFLALVFLILIVTCAEATIAMIYFQLTREDYNWWWRSFLTSGSYGVWLYIYCIFYYFTALHIPSFVSSVLYFGYMFMVSYFFFVLTGFIGFAAAAMFVYMIYSAIKID
eukprot:TRINITY_DN2423_c0_g2_i1.p1 TRINITY_DN2423_c0_g2~~TRINITY_DN2423_c0_g2_i1.p1  ORF type:complete len:639 (+),score=267.37 TRINITY_DN2423_c0_g2_i1:182-2098(+)